MSSRSNFERLLHLNRTELLKHKSDLSYAGKTGIELQLNGEFLDDIISLNSYIYTDASTNDPDDKWFQEMFVCGYIERIPDGFTQHLTENDISFRFWKDNTLIHENNKNTNRRLYMMIITMLNFYHRFLQHKCSTCNNDNRVDNPKCKQYERFWMIKYKLCKKLSESSIANEMYNKALNVAVSFDDLTMNELDYIESLKRTNDPVVNYEMNMYSTLSNTNVSNYGIDTSNFINYMIWFDYNQLDRTLYTKLLKYFTFS